MIMEVEAAKMIGAGLAVIALAGVGVGIGNIFAALVTSIARNPAARGEVFGIGILGFALDRSDCFVRTGCCPVAFVRSVKRPEFATNIP
jgi:F-type H+-transporting ATPase subunit c